MSALGLFVTILPFLIAFLLVASTSLLHNPLL
jgi:hypothetical protein